MKAYDVKIKDLNDAQRVHLAWRLEYKAFCDMLSAIVIAQGEYAIHGKMSNNCTLFEVFKIMGLTDHQAKIHAKKVIDFRLQEGEK